jgi:antitoxin CcdA
VGQSDVQVSKAARRPVNLTLDEDVLREAKALTSNLSATVEQLLTVFVQEERARRREADAALAGVLDALNVFSAKHGLLSDEFPNF